MSERRPGSVDSSFLVRSGLALAEWSERWFPDPLVFALLGVVGVAGAGLLAGESPYVLAVQGGKAFWSLVPFTMQVVMIIIGGYVARPRGRLGDGALVLGGDDDGDPELHTPFALRDQRPDPPHRDPLPLAEPRDDGRPRRRVGPPRLGLGPTPREGPDRGVLRRRPRGRGGCRSGGGGRPKGFPPAAGLALHGTPRRFAAAVARCVPATAGVLIQYPFYAVVFGMIVGYSVLQLVVHVPLVYALSWLFARTIPWVAPVR